MMDTKTPFELLPKPERARLVRALMQTGGSNCSAATALGTTIGAIARTRRDFKIPSRHRAFFAWEPSTPEPAEPPEPSGKPPPPYKLAASEATACADHWEDGRKCEYLAEGGPFCRLHAWMRTRRLT